MSNVIVSSYTYSCLFFQHRFLFRSSMKPVNWIPIMYSTRQNFNFLTISPYGLLLLPNINGRVSFLARCWGQLSVRSLSLHKLQNGRIQLSVNGSRVRDLMNSIHFVSIIHEIIVEQELLKGKVLHCHYLFRKINYTL